MLRTSLLTLPLVLFRPQSVSRARDRFHFEKKVFLYEPVDHGDRVRWIFFSAEERLEMLPAQPHERIDVLRMNEISIEFYDVIEADPQPLEHIFHIGEHLLELCLKVSLADDIAVAVDRKLAGDVVKIAAFYARCMAVIALRRRRSGRIDILNEIGHRLNLLIVLRVELGIKKFFRKQILDAERTA